MCSSSRHVLVIIGFRDLAELAHRGDAQTRNFDLMEEHNFEHCSPFETASLFTLARHFTSNDAHQCHLLNLCNLVAFLLLERWSIELPGDQIELRYEDLWGEVFQLDLACTVTQTLDIWRPRWREHQSSSAYSARLPRCPRHPFVLRMSCHRRIPGVILP